MNPGVTFVNGEPQIRAEVDQLQCRLTGHDHDRRLACFERRRRFADQFLRWKTWNKLKSSRELLECFVRQRGLSGVINVRTRFPDARPLTRISRQVGFYSDPRSEHAKTWNVRPQQSNLRFLHSQQLGTWDIVIGGNILRDDGFLAPEENAQMNARDYHFSPSLIGVDLLDRTVDRYGAEHRARINANLRKRETKVEGLVYGLNTNWQIGESLNTLIWQIAPDSIYGAFGGAATRTNQLIEPLTPMFNTSHPVERGTASATDGSTSTTTTTTTNQTVLTWPIPNTRCTPQAIGGALRAST